MRLVLIACGLAALPCVSRAAEGEPKKVQMFVKSWLLPGTIASELKSGKKITKVEVKEGEPAKAQLAEVLKGKDTMPKSGTYYLQKILVHRGTKYQTYEVYLSAPLAKGTRLKSFTYKGTFTGKIGKDSHKYTLFEATAVKP
jgi:hypothetical protein